MPDHASWPVWSHSPPLESEKAWGLFAFLYNTGYIPSFILISLLTIQFPYTCAVLWRAYTESTGERAKTDRRDQGAPEVCPFRCELDTAKGLGSPPCQSIFLTKLHAVPSTAVRWTAWILCWRVSCLGSTYSHWWAPKDCWGKTIYVSGLMCGYLRPLLISFAAPVAKHTASPASEQDAIGEMVHHSLAPEKWSMQSLRAVRDVFRGPFPSIRSTAIVSKAPSKYGYREPDWGWQNQVY